MTRTAPTDLVVFALRETAALPALTAPAWDLLVRQARRADLLARIACQLDLQHPGAPLPPGVRGHLDAALTVAAAQQAEVRREIRHVVEALAPIGIAVTLLKGAAYLAAGEAAALGRTFADIDIIVPRDRIADAESALMLRGWATTHHAAYDQRYYREWMHELPPLRHVARRTVLDVHHAILPLTARLRPSSALLLSAATAVPGFAGVQVLSPPDMVLHSMTHLFHNEEMSHGLRDLSDIDLLLRAHAGDATFWAGLLARSEQLDLRKPLAQGLRCSQSILGTPVPPAVQATLADTAPRVTGQALQDALWRRGLQAPHPSAAAAFTKPALFALYVRAHWLRMPPLLLARHLLTKALRPTADHSAPP